MIQLAWILLILSLNFTQGQSFSLGENRPPTDTLVSLPKPSTIPSSKASRISALHVSTEPNPSTSSSTKDRIVLATVSCGDQVYRTMAANVLRGLLMFADYDHSYTFIVFTDRKTEWNPLFQRIAQDFVMTEPEVDIDVKLVDIPDVHDDNMTNQFKRCAGFRVTPTFNKALLDMGHPQAIYVDVDIMILDNIAKLWLHFDQMEHMALGLVSVATRYRTGGYMARIKDKSFSKDDIVGLYGVNSGVVLWNAHMVLHQDFSAAVQDIIRTTEKLRWFDQDILNAACKRKQYKVECLILPCRWNFRNDKMSCDCLSERQEGIGIYHGNFGKIPGLKPYGKDFELASLWSSTFPCNNRNQCLRHLQKRLLSLLKNRKREFYCRNRDMMFLGPYNGTEFEFGAKFVQESCGDRRSTYCRILLRVQEMIEKYGVS